LAWGELPRRAHIYAMTNSITRVVLAVTALGAPAWLAGRPRRASDRPEHRSIVVFDIAGSGRWDNLAQLRARAALDRMVRSAFRAAGVAWWRLVVEDRGDGMIVLVPATVSKVDVLDPMVPCLAAALHDYNSVVDPRLRIRLRVAVHAGEVLHAPSGWVGVDLNLACRLVSGEPLHQELSRSPRADLVLVVSDVIYQGVVRHSYRALDPARYTPVQVVLKEVDTRAWTQVLGEPARAIDGAPLEVAAQCASR
jgi:hypothetical protein